MNLAAWIVSGVLAMFGQFYFRVTRPVVELDHLLLVAFPLVCAIS